MTQNVVSDQALPAPKKSRSGLYSQTRNNRWKWMTAAVAGTAGGVAQSYAGMVTITLSNNFISATGGNHLNADLTGDGHPDLTIANVYYHVRERTSSGRPYPSFNRYYARANLNNVLASAFFSNDYGLGYAQLGSRRVVTYRHYGTNSLTGSIPITFTDLHINNGLATKGLLQVTVSSADPKANIQLDSLTFHTPENGSSLELLAMGATSVLALRRWRATQKQRQG